jgi:hypothetical protein
LVSKFRRQLRTDWSATLHNQSICRVVHAI